MTKHSSTTRFSNRVENYIRYRPGYPTGIPAFINKELGISPGSVVADIGSGTGISASLFLENGYTVYGIEPNKEMREAAERSLSRYPAFTSMSGTAEAVPVGDGSIDLIIAAQAFHWFEIDAARKESKRILKKDGWVVLLWNDRDTAVDGFAREYEALLQTLTDYNEVNHKNTGDAAFDRFFGKGNYKEKHFANSQEFDLEGLKGRLMSSSYAPVETDAAYAPMMKELERIFDLYHSDGSITIRYDTKMVYGRIE